jgi:hypothetical protein
MRIRALIFALLLTLLIVPSAAAQDKKPGCDPAALIAELAKLKTTGDQAKDMQALLDVQSRISAQNAVCAGTGIALESKDKVPKVYGPFTLPKGTYKVTATTTGYFIIHAKSSDNCADAFALFNLGPGEGNTGAETLLEIAGDSETCKFYLQTENASAPWKLVIAPLE